MQQLQVYKDIPTVTEDIQSLWDNIPHWVIKTDIARLVYIYLHGGVYLDSDCLVLRDFSYVLETKDVVVFVEHVVPISNLGPLEDKSPEHSVRIANYAFAAKDRYHPFLKGCIDECFRRLRMFLDKGVDPSQQDILWMCGPDVITTQYHSYKKVAKDVVLLDRSFLKHFSTGSWRDKKRI